jgi:hypothetical protein
VHHGEQAVAVLLDLGPLVAARRVFDRQFVQVEFLLHLAHLVVGGVAQRDPDEAVGLVEVVADVLDRDVGQFFAFLVGDAVDQHGISAWQCSLCGRQELTPSPRRGGVRMTEW